MNPVEVDSTPVNSKTYYGHGVQMLQMLILTPRLNKRSLRLYRGLVVKISARTRLGGAGDTLAWKFPR